MECNTCTDCVADTLLPCGHVGCAECVRAIALSTGACLICGMEFTAEQLKPLGAAAGAPRLDAEAQAQMARRLKAERAAVLAHRCALQQHVTDGKAFNARQVDHALSSLQSRIDALLTQRATIAAQSTALNKARDKLATDAADALDVTLAHVESLLAHLPDMAVDVATALPTAFVLPVLPPVRYEIVRAGKHADAPWQIIHTPLSAKHTKLVVRTRNAQEQMLSVLPFNEANEPMDANTITSIETSVPDTSGVLLEGLPWRICFPKHLELPSLELTLHLRSGERETIMTALHNRCEVHQTWVPFECNIAGATHYTVSTCGNYIAAFAASTVWVWRLQSDDTALFAAWAMDKPVRGLCFMAGDAGTWLALIMFHDTTCSAESIFGTHTLQMYKLRREGSFADCCGVGAHEHTLSTLTKVMAGYKLRVDNVTKVAPQIVEELVMHLSAEDRLISTISSDGHTLFIHCNRPALGNRFVWNGNGNCTYEYAPPGVRAVRCNGQLYCLKTDGTVLAHVKRKMAIRSPVSLATDTKRLFVIYPEHISIYKIE